MICAHLLRQRDSRLFFETLDSESRDFPAITVRSSAKRRPPFASPPLPLPIAAADARAAARRACDNNAAGDVDFSSVALPSAADAGSGRTYRQHRAAADIDQVALIRVGAAADTRAGRSARSSHGDDITAGDVDRRTAVVVVVAAADARISSGVDLAAVDRNSAGASGDLA